MSSLGLFFFVGGLFITFWISLRYGYFTVAYILLIFIFISHLSLSRNLFISSTFSSLLELKNLKPFLMNLWISLVSPIICPFSSLILLFWVLISLMPVGICFMRLEAQCLGLTLFIIILSSWWIVSSLCFFIEFCLAVYFIWYQTIHTSLLVASIDLVYWMCCEFLDTVVMLMYFFLLFLSEYCITQTLSSIPDILPSVSISLLVTLST